MNRQSWLRENAVAVGVGLAAVLVLAGLAALFSWWGGLRAEASAARPGKARDVLAPGQSRIELPLRQARPSPIPPAQAELDGVRFRAGDQVGWVAMSLRQVRRYPSASGGGLLRRASGLLIEPQLIDPEGHPAPPPEQTWCVLTADIPPDVRAVSFTLVPARPEAGTQYAYHTHVLVGATRRGWVMQRAAYMAVTREWTPEPLRVRVENPARIEIWLAGDGPRDGQQAGPEDQGVWRPILLADLRVER
jgi:hypothetical protein